MADSTARIEQFRKMTEADPENELGHFSLGKALLEAGHCAPALASFARVVQINPTLSKVFQFQAQALLKLNRRDEAVAALQQGVKVADARGDLMPRNDMARMLKELGADVPESAPAAAVPPSVEQDQVHCTRCGRVGAKLARPPFKGDFGQQIHQQICALCWKEAIAMGTKVINELRLPLADPQAQKVWDQHIREFLNLA